MDLASLADGLQAEEDQAQEAWLRKASDLASQYRGTDGDQVQAGPSGSGRDGGLLQRGDDQPMGPADPPFRGHAACEQEDVYHRLHRV